MYMSGKQLGEKTIAGVPAPHKKSGGQYSLSAASAIKAPMRIPVLVFLSAEHPVKERHHADQQSQ